MIRRRNLADFRAKASTLGRDDAAKVMCCTISSGTAD
jgi:hypothetical protein